MRQLVRGGVGTALVSSAAMLVLATAPSAGATLPPPEGKTDEFVFHSGGCLDAKHRTLGSVVRVVRCNDDADQQWVLRGYQLHLLDTPNCLGDSHGGAYVRRCGLTKVWGVSPGRQEVWWTLINVANSRALSVLTSNGLGNQAGWPHKSGRNVWRRQFRGAGLP